MKEAMGGVSIFQIVIVFILLFTGIMCLTINHSKAYAIKDEVINIIQSAKLNSKPEELKSTTVSAVIEHLDKVGHRITGTCKDGWTGYNKNGNISNNKALFCVKAHDIAKMEYQNAVQDCKKCNYLAELKTVKYYYDVMLFYQLDIPAINHLMNFSLTGSTKLIIG